MATKNDGMKVEYNSETVSTSKSKSNDSFRQQFTALRNRSVPIVVVRSYDLVETVSVIAAANATPPVVQWDAARGMTPVNDAGAKAMTDSGVMPETTLGFFDAMQAALKLPRKTCIVAHNAHMQLRSMDPIATAANVQAVVNLRGPFKTTARMLVLLGPEWTRPVELESEVIAIAHELPDADELATVVRELHASSDKLAPPTDKSVARAVDALSGLSTYIAEQATALSLSDKGLDHDKLWSMKRDIIKQTPGLSVYRGKETFKDLRGIDSVMERLNQHGGARTPIRVVCWVDEGADVFAQVEGGADSNGVKTDQQRALLVEMEQNNWRGIIAVGVPGSGKSAIARAFGNQLGVPTIQLDFGGMESKWQGESEGNLRRAIDVIKAISRGHDVNDDGGGVFFVLTCNSLKGIRPQFQRRFKRGIFFFDLPTKESRAAIWDLYESKYEIAKQTRPDDDMWTGAEIRECCESAWDLKTSLLDAAKFIVPVARSRYAEITAMRKEAHGRFLDASKTGTYEYHEREMGKYQRELTLPSDEGGTVN